MRTLSFENLRRLVGRRKDRDEPSFERSESFKRISIRKSYLDRGKRRSRFQKSSDVSETSADTPVVTVEVSSHIRPKNVIGPTIVQVRSGSNILDEFDTAEKKEKKISRDDVAVIGIREEIEENDDDDEEEDVKKEKRDTPAGTIVYGQWLNDVDSSYSSSQDKKNKIDSYSSRNSKLNIDTTREKIYISQNDYVFTKRNIVSSPVKIIHDEDDKKISSVLIELDKSPHMPRLQSKETSSSARITDENNARDLSKECTCGGVTTVNVVSNGWKDSTCCVTPASNYSLSSNQGFDSSLEGRYNERSYVARSASDKPAAGKTDTTSTRTSGFSLSLSFSRLTTDLRAAALTTKNGLFRRRKRTPATKPSPSVSAEGYFERTAAATTSIRRSRRSQLGSGRRRSVYGSRRRKITKSKPSPAPPDSPVWFVPPERRRSNRQRGRVWREVRYLPQEDSKVDEDNDKNRSIDKSNDSNLSDEFDDQKLLLSGDFEEKSEASLNPKRTDTVSTLDSSSLISSAASSTSLKPKISDFNQDKIFYEEYRGDKSKPVNPTKCNYFASSQFLGFVAKNSGRSIGGKLYKSHCNCTSSSESEPEEQRQRVLVVVGSGKKDSNEAVNLNVNGAIKTANEKRNCSVVLVLEGQRSNASRQQEVGPGQKRRPLRRKSQLRRGSGQPVYLARRRSSLRRRPCSKNVYFAYSY